MILSFRKLIDSKKYFARFILVGLSGIVVNQGALALLTMVYDLEVEWAGIIAIELSIVTNFLLNNYWTWRGRNTQGLWVKFFKYHLVTVVSGVVNYLILVWLTNGGMHALVSNMFGIIAGMIVNFLLNHFWTFQKIENNKEL